MALLMPTALEPTTTEASSAQRARWPWLHHTTAPSFWLFGAIIILETQFIVSILPISISHSHHFHTAVNRHVATYCSVLHHLHRIWTRGSWTKKEGTDGWFPTGWSCRLKLAVLESVTIGVSFICVDFCCMWGWRNIEINCRVRYAPGLWWWYDALFIGESTPQIMMVEFEIDLSVSPATFVEYYLVYQHDDWTVQ